MFKKLILFCFPIAGLSEKGVSIFCKTIVWVLFAPFFSDLI